MIQIQMQMAERALELLTLPDDQPSYILDVGWVATITYAYPFVKPIKVSHLYQTVCGFCLLGNAEVMNLMVKYLLSPFG
jgi:hypothetical protein